MQYILVVENKSTMRSYSIIKVTRVGQVDGSRYTYEHLSRSDSRAFADRLQKYKVYRYKEQ